MLVDGSGTVGIGSTAPANPLHVTGTSASLAQIQNTADYSRMVLNGAASTGGDIIYQTNGTSEWGLVSYSDNSWGVWGNDSSANRYFTITSGGNVGIGTTVPAATLDVSGTIRMAKNTAQPFACDTAHDGVLALTSAYAYCVCKGSASFWVRAMDGVSSCVWNQNVIVTNGSSRNWGDGTYATGCNGYRNPTGSYSYYGSTGDGIYNIDPDGAGATLPMQAYCDMTTDGGGWTLILNYLHKGGTQPARTVRTSNLPIIASSVLGSDESSSNGIGGAWGHVSNSLLSKFTYGEPRLNCLSSQHNRVTYFKTSLAGAIAYANTGTGSMNGLASSYTALDGHSGLNPGNVYQFYTNKGDYAITDFPFYAPPNNYWSIGEAGGAWLCDDNISPGYANHTMHRIWVR